MNRWSCNPVYTKKPKQPSSATALISAAYIISAWAAHPCRSGVGTRSDHLSLDGNRPIELPYIVRPITGGAKLASRSDRRLSAESAVASHLHRGGRVWGTFGRPCGCPGSRPLPSKVDRDNTDPDPSFRYALYVLRTHLFKNTPFLQHDCWRRSAFRRHFTYTTDRPPSTLIICPVI